VPIFYSPLPHKCFPPSRIGARVIRFLPCAISSDRSCSGFDSFEKGQGSNHLEDGAVQPFRVRSGAVRTLTTLTDQNCQWLVGVARDFCSQSCIPVHLQQKGEVNRTI
jgi:hypothetical protein